MEHFLIISNVDRDPEHKNADEIASYIRETGKVCEVVEVSRGADFDETLDTIENKITNDIECALVLGGDGTIIQVAGALAKNNIPLLGINLGRLGFLAEVDRDMIFEAVDKIMNNDFYLEERMMLEGMYQYSGCNAKRALALNDIVITRSGPMRVIDYDIYVNDKLLTTINGDGVVISTPTGSTGYSMSAGGPIVEPGANIIVITPISAHKLNSRPIVLSPGDEITVCIASEKYDNNAIAGVSFDGGITYEMDKGDKVIVKKAKEITRIMKISKESFIDVLSRKLSS